MPIRNPSRLIHHLLAALLISSLAHASNTPELPRPVLTAYSRQLRVDLTWPETDARYFEIQSSSSPGGPYIPLHQGLHSEVPAYCDFIGKAHVTRYYRLRSVNPDESGGISSASEWSEVVQGTSQPHAPDLLLTELQEASWRYFYHYGHPVSGFAREGAPRKPELCTIGATGMGLFNLGVGVERGFSTRQEGATQALKILKFLHDKADRFHGVFPHWINGETGETIPFSQYDDGADLVETAYLAQGLLYTREFFDQDHALEKQVRSLADKLWREIEWDWFASEKGGRACLFWHWSPNHGWRMNMPVRGFNECQITYLLALASPTHPAPMKAYQDSWYNDSFSTNRTDFGVQHELGQRLGFPLFFAHYSYLGFDPRQVVYNGKTYFEHFTDACKVQLAYAHSRQIDFMGYGPLWGLTASLDPTGYMAHEPGSTHDNGTISPTAALSSMPYLPEASLQFLQTLYLEYGKRTWGPFGPIDAFNYNQNWFSPELLGIDVGPIGPMVENHLTGSCWQTFMRAPEIQALLSRLPDRP
jgi:hypothetical protein